MPKKLCFFIVGILFLSFYLITPKPSFSDELDDLKRQIGDLTTSLNRSIAATKPLESELENMQAQITQIKSRVNAIEADVAVKKKEIDRGYIDLAKKQELLNKTIQDYYINSYSSSPLLVFLSAQSASQVTRTLAYQKAVTNQDKSVITNIALSIVDLEIKKKALDSEETRLATAKANLDEQSAKLDNIIVGAKEYQKTLSSQIAQLSARQQALLAQKLASLNIPTSAYTTQGGCIDDRNVDPGFSPRFAFFTYGVPNRVGLNQYGAKGRAEAGLGYEEILKAYYDNVQISDYDTGATITVNGTNEYGQTFSNQSMNIEDYVKHIYEMPTNWPAEALKAQAIAARSYALRVQNEKGFVTPSQSNQVIKQEINSQSWQDAVDQTRGKVLMQDGKPIKAWFSSTHGGYVFKTGEIGWNDTSWTKHATDANGSINSFSDLQNNAYDKGSPWFYCDWGSRAQYNKTAWLKADEVADIVNALQLAKKDSSTQTHLSQADKPNPDNVETWDAGRVKQELQNRGINPYNSITDVTIDWDKGGGRTTSIQFSGDAGSTSFDGVEFKNFFNLRAPANIQIVGPLYNIEKK